MEIDPIDERIRQLCQAAATAREEEMEDVLRELRAALREHSRFVRRMTAQTFSRISTTSTIYSHAGD